MQAMNTIRDTILPIPCRKLTGNTSVPFVGEAIAAMKQINPSSIVVQYEKRDGIWAEIFHSTEIAGIVNC